ncbi:hypothetical protein [uncultured Parabacteroides sp.]|nr:hypothetical protein [uncultured Parabacteroides sp.]
MIKLQSGGKLALLNSYGRSDDRPVSIPYLGEIVNCEYLVLPWG